MTSIVPSNNKTSFIKYLNTNPRGASARADALFCGDLFCISLNFDKFLKLKNAN